LAPLHSLHRVTNLSSTKIGENERGRDGRDRTIEGDGESGQNRLAFPSRKDEFLFRLAFLIKQIRKNHHIENVTNPPSPSFVEPCIVSDPNLPGASLP